MNSCVLSNTLSVMSLSTLIKVTLSLEHTKKPHGLILTIAPLPPANGWDFSFVKSLISPYSPPPPRYPTVVFKTGIIVVPLGVKIGLPIIEFADKISLNSLIDLTILSFEVNFLSFNII